MEKVMEFYFVFSVGTLLLGRMCRCPTGIHLVTFSILGPATSFIVIWSWNNTYGLPTADSSRAVVSYWRQYGHLVLVNRLGSLPRNSMDRLTDWLDMTLIVLTGP